MSKNWLQGGTEWALMVALVFGTGAIAQAQEDQPDGPVIHIGPADGNAAASEDINVQGIPDQPQQEVPKYWIGLLAGAISPDHPLRAHVEIPEGQGLLVANVVPDSPASKAGLKVHDIILRANDSDLHDMNELIELVLTGGESKSQIALEVLRRGQRETVYITPEERPANLSQPQAGAGGGGFGQEFNIPGGGDARELLREFGNMPFEFRNFGPGMIVGRGGMGHGMGVAGMPNGVSVSIQKEDDKAPRITVKRGDDTWEVVGDDPESLKQLPEDLRPFVEQMLQGGAGGSMGFGREMGRGEMPGFGDGRLRERLERMEQRMQELQERLMAPEEKPTEQPTDGQDQIK